MKRLELPRLYLGTMTLGWSQASSYVDAATAATMFRAFRASQPPTSNIRVDTARIYAGGQTEPIVRQALRTTELQDVASIGSKAHPSQPGGLSPQGIISQFAASCNALGVDRLAEFFLHQPDTENDLLASLVAVDALVRDGKVGEIGMSNYHASEVARAMALCDAHTLAKPTVYQGLYNPLNRKVEEELLPVLRQYGCAFIAYNPLAAGLLTGRHASVDNVAKGRFKDNPNYMPRFYNEENFAALAQIRTACEASGVSMVEATYRWLLSHSALDPAEGDGLLIGASSPEQLDANLAACAAAHDEPPLPQRVVEALDGAWSSSAALRECAFPYWRSYSADMPGRDSLDPGASYSAAKK